MVDDPITDTPPALFLVNDAGFLTTATTLNVGEPFSVKVETVPGTQPLDVLSIFENGTLLPASRIQIKGLTANNPLLILGADKQGAIYEITIQADPAVTDADSYSYAFEVEDEGDLIETVTLDITTENAVVLTDIEMELNGVLFGQAGDTGFGGLDLDTGETTGSSDPDAEIQDEGIDLDLVAADNWRRQISAANDAELRYVDFAAFGDGQLTFAAVQFQEEVAEAFNTGTAPDGEDFSGGRYSDEEGDEEVSRPVVVGDVFAVRRGDRTYLLECTAVNVEPTDNTDNYEFSIKY